MVKVYVVLYGDYDDFGLEGMFSTFEKAQEAASKADEVERAKRPWGESDPDERSWHSISEVEVQ